MASLANRNYYIRNHVINKKQKKNEKTTKCENRKKGKTEKLIATKTKCDEMKWQKGQRVCHRRTQSVTEIHFVLRLNIYFASIDARFTVLNLHLTIRDARIAIAVDDRQLCTLFQMELRDDPIKMGSTKKKKKLSQKFTWIVCRVEPVLSIRNQWRKTSNRISTFFCCLFIAKNETRKTVDHMFSGAIRKAAKSEEKANDWNSMNVGLPDNECRCSTVFTRALAQSIR